MAAPMRSMTRELIEGATDGAIKKTAPNWSNRVCDETDSARNLLSKGAGEGGGFDWSPYDGDKSEYVRGYIRGA
jgi:hypothetical protein